MHDWFFKQGGRDKLINWMGVDSKLDSTVAETWGRLKDAWNAGSSFFARFRLVGWKRLANEAACEALTLGAGGLVVLYVLALPALLEFDENKFLTGKFSVKFLDKNGEEIGKRGILHNDSIPLEEIPETLINATLATEDRRFFEHFGVDFIGTARALATNINAGETVQGGSTLTQQLAKNLFLSFERSLQRKIKEVFLAFLLESRFSKRDIMKMYFDRAYMGGGAFGVEAAAQLYFGKSVREINLAESAMLAGLFKAPTKYSPLVNLPSARARASDVLDNVVKWGFYSPGQVHAARLHPAKVVETRTTYSPDWYLDWAFEEVQRLAEGKNQFVLTARTTIDQGVQKSADEVLSSTLRQHGKSLRINSGSIVVTETDGAVRAIVGGPDYGESQFNRATHAKRQPGSSFKPYVYATALENGFTSRSSVSDSAPTCGNWSPKNYNGGGGSGSSVQLGDALARSLNTVAVYLSLKVGRQKVVEMTRRLGIRGIKPSCSMALGDYGISPLEHTGGFATFANGGRQARPYGILELVNSKGELVYSRERDEAEAPQIVTRKVVEQMNQMMQLVVTEGTAKSAALDFTHAAGKTGTTSSYKDAWFVGFTGRYVASVWLGNDDNRPMHQVTGGQVPAPAWHSLMALIHTDMNFPTIPGLPTHPRQAEEAARLAAEKRNDPTQQDLATSAGANGMAGQRKSQSLMPEQTREALKKVAVAMRKAANLPEPQPSVQPAIAPSATQPTGPQPASGPAAASRPDAAKPDAGGGAKPEPKPAARSDGKRAEAGEGNRAEAGKRADAGAASPPAAR